MAFSLIYILLKALLNLSFKIKTKKGESFKMYSLPWPYVNAAPATEGAGQSRLAGHPTDGPPAHSFACVHNGAHVVPSPPSIRWPGMHVGQATGCRQRSSTGIPHPLQGPPRGRCARSWCSARGFTLVVVDEC